MHDAIDFDLGAFRLERPLARGGGGEVWRAVHRRSNLPVAVKLLRDDWGGAPAALAAFQHEVRAVARLHHPHVIRILDYGMTPEDSVNRSAGLVADGAPWLVMELAAGSLEPYEGRLYWHDLHAIAVALCEALAHAHARRLLHLDVKPGNVLFGCRLDGVEPAEDPLEGLRLADFGISRARGQMDGKLAGTPLFMAPEQIVGDVEALGPWTDMYALGATLWCLATGKAPFDGNDIQAVMRQHLLSRLPAFNTTGGIPHEFEDWLHWLLEKRGMERPASAAAALTALRTMAPHDVRQPSTRKAGPAGPRSADTFDLLGQTLDPLPVPSPELMVERTLEWPSPTLPANWRHPDTRPTPAVAMLDAGLGLLGLREVPLVGRDASCDALWEQLKGVVESGAARFVSLEGPGGCGRTRMLRWMAQRADESGVFTTLRSEHGEGNGGLRQAFIEVLGLAEVPPRERRERIMAVVPGLVPWMAGRLEGWLYVGKALPLDLLMPVLNTVAACRPLLWVMDDFTEEEDAVLAIRAALSLTELTLLMVGSVRSDAPPGPGLALADSIPADSKAVVELAPLPRKELSRLLVDLLRLDPWLASSVLAQARGLPAEMVSRLVSWAVADVLYPGENGFEVDEDFLDRTQTTRPVLDHLIATARGASTPWMRAIEFAAASGMSTDRAGWEAGAEGADSSLLKALLDARIAREIPGGWAFTGPRLWRAARHNAIRHDRWARHHAAWIALLPEDAAAEARLARGRHLHLSGRSNEALQPLSLAMRDLRESARLRLAEEAWIVLESALEASDLPADHPHRENARIEQLLIVYVRGNSEAILETSQALQARAEEHGWKRSLIRAHNTVGNYLLDHRQQEAALERYQLAASLAGRWTPNSELHVLVLESVARGHRNLADFDTALVAAERSVEVARREPTGIRLDSALANLAEICVSRGEIERAENITDEVLAVARSIGEPLKIGCALINVSAHAARRGEIDEARARSSEGLAIIREAGADMFRGWALFVAGGQAQQGGDLDAAFALFSEAATLAYSTNPNMATYPVINLAQIEIERGKMEDAHRRLMRLRDVVGSKPGDHSSLIMDVHILWTAAAVGDLEAGIRAYDWVEEHLTEKTWREDVLVDALEKTVVHMSDRDWIFASGVEAFIDRVRPRTEEI